jgi:hypothetical protein
MRRTWVIVLASSLWLVWRQRREPFRPNARRAAGRGGATGERRPTVRSIAEAAAVAEAGAAGTRDTGNVTRPPLATGAATSA